MRTAALQLASILLLGAALAARGEGTPTGSSDTPPPMPPHWYQSVKKGVTVTNLTPVAYFRGLLGMTPAERQRVLADKSAAERDQVLAKVLEYKALPREVCEERLRQTELHWNLLALLPLEPAQRQERLKECSPLFLPMIGQRLAQWDQLPADMRKALLRKESSLSAYVQWQDQSTSALPEAERRQMEQALRSFADLPSALQRQCAESFSKFAEMSAEDRDQFLQNAAKWETMTEHERQLWRTMVNKLPPKPPGFPGPRPPGWPPPQMPSQPAGGGPGVTNMAKAAK
jgi:hypothetical protein